MLQVGASSRRRAMALRWRNRPTAAQRSRTMTWKVGPPRILCLSLSPLEKKKQKKKSSILALPLFARSFFFRALDSQPLTLSSILEICMRGQILRNRRILNKPQSLCRRTIFPGPGCIENVCSADHFTLSLPFLRPPPPLSSFSSVECTLGTCWSNRSGCSLIAFLFCLKGGCYRY